MTKNKRVAILHDAFSDFGGGERVALKFLSMFPRADLYTLYINKEVSRFQEMCSNNRHVYTSFFQHLSPFKNVRGFQTLLLIFASTFWKNLNLSEYDLIISSTFGYNAKLAKGSIKSTHISYIHNPSSFLYELPRQRYEFLGGQIASRLKKLDFAGGQTPHLLIANSKFTKRRIENYYHRKATVVYPPVVTPPFSDKRNISEEYYVTFSRLDGRKGIELAIKAFNRLNKKLVVIGTGREEKNLRKIAGSNIFFSGFVPENRLPPLLANAKAMINCATDEDFGMAPVEAMANGTPVIAYASGGVLETVKHKKSGLLFYDYNPSSICRLVEILENSNLSPRQCRYQAQQFSEIRFEKKIKKIIKDTIEKRV